MTNRVIFVFGANREGRHGKGAAKYAADNHGAIRGQGEGLQGSSYAIPTKSSPYEFLSLTEIQGHVDTSRTFAKDRPDLTFQVTPIGTGHAGHKVQGIAPLFRDMPPNVQLPYVFLQYLEGSGHNAWDEKIRKQF